jgi:hypothetical protein
MDWFTGLETHYKLVAFNEASGADWMLRVTPEYAKSPAFQKWLDEYYDQYITEEKKPLSEGYTLADKNAKLEEIVNDFHENYNSLKTVLDSIPQNASGPENACDSSTLTTRDGRLASTRICYVEKSTHKKRPRKSKKSVE